MRTSAGEFILLFTGSKYIFMFYKFGLLSFVVRSDGGNAFLGIRLWAKEAVGGVRLNCGITDSTYFLIYWFADPSLPERSSRTLI